MLSNQQKRNKEYKSDNQMVFLTHTELRCTVNHTSVIQQLIYKELRRKNTYKFVIHSPIKHSIHVQAHHFRGNLSKNHSGILNFSEGPIFSALEIQRQSLKKKNACINLCQHRKYRHKFPFGCHYVVSSAFRYELPVTLNSEAIALYV